MSETHEGVHRHPAPTGFIRKYIFSIDHKVIGIQYIMLALAAVMVGMLMSLLMRLQSVVAGNRIGRFWKRCFRRARPVA